MQAYNLLYYLKLDTRSRASMVDSGYIVYTKFLEDRIRNRDLTNFKNHPDYTYMLEHVTSLQGYEYLRLIQNKTDITADEIQQYCKLNDQQGNPTKSFFLSFEASPTSLRYIWHAHLILSFLQKLKKSSHDILELGGGYGGLCFAISFFAKKYGVHISTYTIIDLPAPLELQKLYISKLPMGFPIEYVNASTYGAEISKTNLFLISNYCFSEISSENQKEYIRNLFPKVEHGFFAWNTIPVYNFGFPVYVEEEIPKTGEFNKIVYF